jgi:hypothetical protein
MTDSEKELTDECIYLKTESRKEQGLRLALEDRIAEITAEKEGCDNCDGNANDERWGCTHGIDEDDRPVNCVMDEGIKDVVSCPIAADLLSQGLDRGSCHLWVKRRG